MKVSLTLALSFLSVSQIAMAESQLTCWNIYDKRGAAPVMKASIQGQTDLANVQFDFKNNALTGYFNDRTTEAGPRWPGKTKTEKSMLQNPAAKLVGQVITSNRRATYKGNHSYVFDFGTWSVESPYYNNKGIYDAELILPRDLSSKSLSLFRIRVPSERSNAVVILPPPSSVATGANQSGSNYLRMYCLSK